MIERFRSSQGGFRRLRAASSFARGGKGTKTPPGAAQGERSPLLFALSPAPFSGGTPWTKQKILARKICMIGCHSVRPHWGPEWEEN